MKNFKKVLIVLLILIVIGVIGFAIYMWQNQDINKSVNTILSEAMNNKRKFICEDNSEVLFKDFKITENQTAKVDKYTFVDMDKDGNEELVILATSDYGAYIILHYQEGKVYGYMLGIRSLEELKKDGSFIGNSGVGLNEYSVISFDKNTYQIKMEALNDETNKLYIINDSVVTEKEIKEYVTNWTKKENVNWTK